ncbi:hypothetical protein GGX14DRAFT_666955 [Mycena pura]|uniref:Uncharacterized protein n=1 Tax=Mycena pura TaxID=153505 RepID=A0AAD6Y2L9_9AGAR|nr:hypothetical protein GGX14DRAFT_666955 [Mycena pura]
MLFNASSFFVLLAAAMATAATTSPNPSFSLDCGDFNAIIKEELAMCPTVTSATCSTDNGCPVHCKCTFNANCAGLRLASNGDTQHQSNQSNIEFNTNDVPLAQVRGIQPKYMTVAIQIVLSSKAGSEFLNEATQSNGQRHWVQYSSNNVKSIIFINQALGDQRSEPTQHFFPHKSNTVPPNHSFVRGESKSRPTVPKIQLAT